MKKNLINFYKLYLCVILAFGLSSCQTETLTDSNDASTIDKKGPRNGLTITDCNEVFNNVNLYAGQNILVGNVSVTGNNGNYEVTYNITNVGYCLVETHLSVVTNPNSFPMTGSGNPIPGQFEYSESHSCLSSYTYSVNLGDFEEGDEVYIAAHGVVNCVSDITNEAFEMALPDQVDVCVTAKGVSPSYFNIDIAGENSLSGAYEAWCLDQDASLNNSECFIGDVYSSYETLPPGKFEQPENFGALNWLMNQGFIGSEATPELGNYTFGDIQIAIWNLVDDSVCFECSFTGPYNNDRIDMLVAMALENTDFVPSCGENLVIVIVPTDNKQSIFVTIPVPCGDCDETAWADGCEFPGNNWATFFQYGQ